MIGGGSIGSPSPGALVLRWQSGQPSRSSPTEVTPVGIAGTRVTTRTTTRATSTTTTVASTAGLAVGATAGAAGGLSLAKGNPVAGAALGTLGASAGGLVGGVAGTAFVAYTAQILSDSTTGIATATFHFTGDCTVTATLRYGDQQVVAEGIVL